MPRFDGITEIDVQQERHPRKVCRGNEAGKQGTEACP